MPTPNPKKKSKTPEWSFLPKTGPFKVSGSEEKVGSWSPDNTQNANLKNQAHDPKLNGGHFRMGTPSIEKMETREGTHPLQSEVSTRLQT